MGCGYGDKFRRAHDEAWSYLVEELHADVALVQESLLQASLAAPRPKHFFVRGAWKRSCDWGSGVYVRALPAEETEFAVGEGVHVAAARIQTRDGSVLAVSVHVSTDGDQEERLALLADSLAERARTERIIVGGDFNAARLFDENHGYDFNAFFEAMRNGGFFECHWRMHGREEQTLWRKGTKEPYQDDHIFVSETLAPQVRACAVVDAEQIAAGKPPVAVTRKLSDHGPVLLDVDL